MLKPNSAYGCTTARNMLWKVEHGTAFDVRIRHRNNKRQRGMLPLKKYTLMEYTLNVTKTNSTIHRYDIIEND